MIQPNLTFVSIAFSVVLLVLWLVLLRRRTLPKRAVIWSLVLWLLIVGLFTAWVAADMFRLWNDNPTCTACQVHLPPYSNYWYWESFGRYGLYFGIHLVTGLVFGWALWLYALRTNGRVVDRDDVFLLTIAGVMVGWPNILIFLVGLFLASIVVSIAKRLLARRVTNPQVIITPLIPLVAIVVVLWGDTIARAVRLYDLGLVALSLY